MNLFPMNSALPAALYTAIQSEIEDWESESWVNKLLMNLILVNVALEDQTPLQYVDVPILK